MLDETSNRDEIFINDESPEESGEYIDDFYLYGVDSQHQEYIMRKFLTTNSEKIRIFGFQDINNNISNKNCKDCDCKLYNSTTKGLCGLCFYSRIVVDANIKIIKDNLILNEIEKYLIDECAKERENIPLFHWFMIDNVKCGIIYFDYYFKHHSDKRETLRFISEDIEYYINYLRNKLHNEMDIIFFEIELKYDSNLCYTTNRTRRFLTNEKENLNI